MKKSPGRVLVLTTFPSFFGFEKKRRNAICRGGIRLVASAAYVRNVNLKGQSSRAAIYQNRTKGERLFNIMECPVQI